jgi:hypothetical protein
MDCRFHLGSTMLVAGPTWSGKSSFIVKLLDNAKQLFDFEPENVYWYFGQITDEIPKLAKKNYIMHEGLPENFNHVEKFSVIVLDDLMAASANHKGVTALFTKAAHHRRLFVIYMHQNLLEQSPEARTRHLNTQYLVLFDNPRDKYQITVLSRQMYPSHPKYLVNIFADATLKQYGYLLVDLHKRTSDLIRLRVDVLPHERPMRAYVDKQLYAKVVPLTKRLQRPIFAP